MFANKYMSINQNPNNKIKLQFLAEIEFGNAKTKDCRNYGICRIFPVGKGEVLRRCTCGWAQAIITVFDKNQCEIHFLKGTINPFTYKRNFSNKLFIMEDDFQWDFFQKERIYIPSGQYLIIENNSLLKIDFRKTLK